MKHVLLRLLPCLASLASACGGSPPTEAAELSECMAPQHELHGFVVVRSSDVVVSTPGGELRTFARHAFDEGVWSRTAAELPGMPWLVMGTADVSEASVRAIAERVGATGSTDVRPCAPGPSLTIDPLGRAAWAVTDEAVATTPSATGELLPGFEGTACRPRSRPIVRTVETATEGSLSREVVRRVIQRHVNEILACYAAELDELPALEGRVGLRFVITATGAVEQATITSSSLDSENVEACILAALPGWAFPAPDGGTVRATATLLLEPRDGHEEPSEAHDVLKIELPDGTWAVSEDGRAPEPDGEE